MRSHDTIVVKVTCATGQPAAGVQGPRGSGGAQAAPGIRCSAAAVGELGALGLSVVRGQQAGVRAQPPLRALGRQGARGQASAVSQRADAPVQGSLVEV